MIALDVDPNLVVSGWTPLFLTLGLGGVIVLLALSMTRHMRRVRPDLPRRRPGAPEPEPHTDSEDDQPADAGDPEPTVAGGDAVGAGSAATPTEPRSADSAR